MSQYQQFVQPNIGIIPSLRTICKRACEKNECKKNMNF